MCGRFGFIYPSPEDWADVTADLTHTDKFKESYAELRDKTLNRTNIAPTQIIPTIVYSQKEESYLVVPMRWGWEPVWMKYGQLHNANFQTVMNPSKSTWKKDLIERRCLIPASFFYDWQRRNDGTKIPWKIERADRKLMFFAGLYQYAPIRKNPNEKVLTTAMITYHGNRLMQMINNDEPPGTQPVFLERNQLGLWLDPMLKNPQVISTLIQQYREEEITVTPLLSVGNDKIGAAPIEREWIDPYDVQTEYYPEPISTRYQKPDNSWCT
ncbi:MAG: hypothetical protein LDLANPLL_00762 [Turneriella sp.]|nr:hypothetical protein [Turneriella sp.]